MAHDGTIEPVGAHPAPHRDRAEAARLAFSTLAPPLAWAVHLTVNYGFSSHACYPAGEPLLKPLARFDWVRLLLLAVDLAAIAVGIVAIVVAYRSWSATAGELAETGPPLMEIGEGRTRFLAIWGVLIGLGFAVAILFDFVGLWIIPICG